MIRFVPSTDISGFNQAKSSVVRGVRAKLLLQYPLLADYIDDIIPKKEAVQIIKWWILIPPDLRCSKLCFMSAMST